MELKLSEHRNREILHTFNKFFSNESTGGILLLICTVIAVTLATIPGGEWFDRMWNTQAGFDIGGFSMNMSLRHWVNDAMMAVFFFVAGLEIKREMLVGQLSSFKRLIDIYSSTAKTVDALMKLELPSGVEVEIKV